MQSVFFFSKFMLLNFMRTDELFQGKLHKKKPYIYFQYWDLFTNISFFRIHEQGLYTFIKCIFYLFQLHS